MQSFLGKKTEKAEEEEKVERVRGMRDPSREARELVSALLRFRYLSSLIQLI